MSAISLFRCFHRRLVKLLFFSVISLWIEASSLQLCFRSSLSPTVLPLLSFVVRFRYACSFFTLVFFSCCYYFVRMCTWCACGCVIIDTWIRSCMSQVKEMMGPQVVRKVVALNEFEASSSNLGSKGNAVYLERSIRLLNGKWPAHIVHPYQYECNTFLQFVRINWTCSNTTQVSTWSMWWKKPHMFQLSSRVLFKKASRCRLCKRYCTVNIVYACKRQQTHVSIHIGVDNLDVSFPVIDARALWW